MVSIFEMQQRYNHSVVKKAKAEFVADGPLSKCDGIALSTRSGFPST
jgi:hypothetical protein